MRVNYIVCLALLLASGCGKSGAEVGEVSGKVTFDGRPLQWANVSFQQQGKGAGSGVTDQDGNYTLIYKRGIMGAPVGKDTVTIVLDTESAHKKQFIPPKYNAQTTLERDVQPGKNEFNFDLKSD